MINPPSANAHWRDSARHPLLFFIDARAVFPIIFCLLHIKVWTISIALAFTVFFGVLSHYKFTIAVFGRWLRAALAGRRKSSQPWWL